MKPITILMGVALIAASSSWLVAQSNQMLPSAPEATSSSAEGAYGASKPEPPAKGRFTNDHAEIGVFADYFRLAPANNATNYVGVGARVGFNFHPNVALEAEMSYDFDRNYTTVYHNGATTTFVRSSVRPITALFGPKFQVGTSGPVRAFVTGKVGLVDFGVNSSGVVSGTTFSDALAGIGGSGTHFAIYPGGGLEFFGGPIGFRIDAGDEIYLNNGTYNNLKVSAGPVLRF